MSCVPRSTRPPPQNKYLHPSILFIYHISSYHITLQLRQAIQPIVAINTLILTSDKVPLRRRRADSTFGNECRGANKSKNSFRVSKLFADIIHP
jgi:hypothetical protein